jgi:outer membrane protein, heavy metal efflux system
VLELAKADLEYYDKIIDISKSRPFKAGDLAQIDLDRIELLRVQYESEIQTAIVNLRTAEDCAAAVAGRPHAGDQFDVSGPFDFASDLKPLTTSSRRRWMRGPTARRDPGIEQSKTNHKLAISNGSTDPTYSAWYTYNSSNNNPNGMQTLGLSVSIPLRIFDKNQGEKQRTLIDIDRNQQADRSGRGAGLQRRGLAYEQVRSNIALLKPYKRPVQGPGGLCARHRDLCLPAWRASLMDFLNAQSDYRVVQLAYLQLVGAYLTAAGQMNLAVGREVIP